MTILQRGGLRRMALGTAVLAGLVAPVAAAHDFWVVPISFSVVAGEPPAIRGQTGTKFPGSESAVAPERVLEARLIGTTEAERLTDFSVSEKSREVGFATLVFRAEPSGGRQRSSDSSEVARVVEAYHAAELAGDSAAMLALLDEDAVILESGGIETKGDFRAHHIAADIAYIRSVQVERSPIRVRTRGDAAWATSTSTAQGNVNGRAINSAGAELMVLARTPTGWEIAAIHWSSRARRAP